MGKRKNQTAPENLNAAERRNDALTLRRQGQSYRLIARTLIAKYGVENLPKNYDERYASDDVHEELKRLKALSHDTAEELRQMELEKLELAERGISKQVTEGHLGAIDRWLRIMERRAKLLGLDIPVKQINEHTGADGKPLIDLSGLSAEQLEALARGLGE